MNKISEEQLNKIKDQQLRMTNHVSNVGVLESQKHGVLHEIGNLNQEIEATKRELENQYGQVNINLETGEYEPIELPKPELVKEEVVSE